MGDRKIAPCKIASWKIAPQQISPSARVRVRVGGNLPGVNLPRGNFPSTLSGKLLFKDT